MIEPWQIWLADLDPTVEHEQNGLRPVVVISSAFHIRLLRETTVTVVPITSRHKPVSNRIQITTPKGESNWVITDQIRTLSTLRFVRSTPWWTLSDYEIREVSRALKAMVAF